MRFGIKKKLKHIKYTKAMRFSPDGTFCKIRKPAIHDSWNKSIRTANFGAIHQNSFYAGEHTKSLLKKHPKSPFFFKVGLAKKNKIIPYITSMYNPKNEGLEDDGFVQRW